MKILCVFGRHNYGDPNRGQGYEYTNFLPTFRRSGYDVVFFESFSRQAYTDFCDLNRQLIRTATECQPDLIFCVLQGYEVWKETLTVLKAVTDAVIINWATDDSWKYDQFSRFIIPYFDLYATTYPEALSKAQKAGYGNVILTQWAANAENLCAPMPSDRCRWDVSFVGSAYGNRKKWISDLNNSGIQVTCFGHGWENGPVDAEQIPTIIRNSKISLNFGDSNWLLKGILPTRSRQIKARVFEVPGYGGFLMTEKAKHIQTFLQPGEEIVLFDGQADLAEKIRYFLAHPTERDKIADAGHRKIRSQHTYDHRFKALFRVAQRIKTAPSTAIKATGYANANGFETFNDLAARHCLTPFLKLLRKLLITPSRLIWGPIRGPRAARRMLFEMSWRICGKKTYSASGWPGRLFYHES